MIVESPKSHLKLVMAPRGEKLVPELTVTLSLLMEVVNLATGRFVGTTTLTVTGVLVAPLLSVTVRVIVYYPAVG